MYLVKQSADNVCITDPFLDQQVDLIKFKHAYKFFFSSIFDIIVLSTKFTSQSRTQ